MFQLSSPGREGEKVLLQYGRIEDRWMWRAFEGTWNDSSREFVKRQVICRTEDETVLDENGSHCWQMNNNACPESEPGPGAVADWQWSLHCTTKNVIHSQS